MWATDDSERVDPFALAPRHASSHRPWKVKSLPGLRRPSKSLIYRYEGTLAQDSGWKQDRVKRYFDSASLGGEDHRHPVLSQTPHPITGTPSYQGGATAAGWVLRHRE